MPDPDDDECLQHLPKAPGAGEMFLCRQINSHYRLPLDA